MSGRSRVTPYLSKNEQTTAKLAQEPGGGPAAAPGAAIFPVRVRLETGGPRPAHNPPRHYEHPYITAATDDPIITGHL